MTTPAYPEIPGFKRMHTSHEASIYAQDRATFIRPKVLALLAREELTADEVAERLGETIFNVRPRLSELRAVGKIVPTGARRKSANGHSQAVWRAWNPKTIS